MEIFTPKSARISLAGLEDGFAYDANASLIECTQKLTIDHQDDGHDFGSHVFEANNGLDEVESTVPLRFVTKEVQTVELLRDLAAESVDQEAFYVVDLSIVMAKLDRWRELMPRVRPFYAVKCNNDDAICRLLAKSGCGFDCASQAEIRQCLDIGVPPEDIIYANPCKQRSMLKFAETADVRLMTVDNTDELEKIAQTFPNARLVLRIAVDDSKSVCRFNSKFGAHPSAWSNILATAQRLGLDMVGTSFHVGSGCGDLQPFADAVASARDCFNLAKTYGFKMTLLDCGGGYPGSDNGHLCFDDVAKVVSAAVDIHFPPSCGVSIIAEPGRYMVSACHTYAVCVIAKRDITAAQLADAAAIESFGARPGIDVEAEEEEELISSDDHHDKTHSKDPEVALYINDGVYGSFNCVVFDHALIIPNVLHAPKNNKLVPTKLFGPTCDSIDVVMACTDLPPLRVGDWLYFNDMGAYTRCAASRFNGQGGFTVNYIWTSM